MRVSIIIPVLNKLEFTRQCLDRIWRHTDPAISYEVIVVDNGSTDGTASWFTRLTGSPKPVRYHRNPDNLGFSKANNIGARLAAGEFLLFLNNDTMVRPGWLSEMLRLRVSDDKIGVVGIKQLFPYTNTLYHTGIVFAPGGIPQHLYPHLDASLPHVNQERGYQAVTGSCLLIDRDLFGKCGGFDEAYVNGYEDVDLCMKVSRHGRTVVCCTTAYIYHYGQVSEGRTADDNQNARLFAERWGGRIRVDQDDYLTRDRLELGSLTRTAARLTRQLSDDCIYLADDLVQGSALSWANAELALALCDRGAGVFVNGTRLSRTLPKKIRERLRPLALPRQPSGGVQIKWSHYWARHLNLELAGDVNAEFFVINYQFGRPGEEPWDHWLQCLRQNHHAKLPVSEFCESVLFELGVRSAECHVSYLGYSREIPLVEPPRRRDSTFRFLTVTNSHDLGRYNTLAVIDAFESEFGARDDVALVVKDYGASSHDETIRRRLAQRRDVRIEYLTDFTDKPELVRLYKSCDAFISAHRGEGFGMKILDAMACGLPVITPLFGGPTAYCRPDNCFPVAFELAPLSDCLDRRSLRITNSPMWAEVDGRSLREQMRRVHDAREDARTVAAKGRDTVVKDFSWDRAADRLIGVATQLRGERTRVAGTRPEPAPSRAEQSPYWLGLRVSVVVPTHNRRQKLLACLAALGRQSVLPQEYEVLVIDDGSTDGTGEAVDAGPFPFALRYFRQEPAGPGAARNLGIEMAAGEHVLFVGDDIYADERLIEEHLLAHAANPDPGVAVLGHIDWPGDVKPNAVMEYVCGDAMLQFAYSYIAKAPVLDHRFFYTSNVSLKRQFLIDAADSGIRFDSCFRHAAFEDSEFALRLSPRGLRLKYTPSARAVHDHWMDLADFAAREYRAGQMAVVFYRKHPGQDPQLDVQWVEDLVSPAATLAGDATLLERLAAFDAETDALLRSLAGALEQQLQIGAAPPSGRDPLSTERLRAALHSLLRVVFDVERTRGKVREWYGDVEDAQRIKAASVIGTMLRKVRFLETASGQSGVLAAIAGPLGSDLMSSLGARVGVPAEALPSGGNGARSARASRALRLLANPRVVRLLLSGDRMIQHHLQSPAREPWLERYRRLRSRFRRLLP